MAHTEYGFQLIEKFLKEIITYGHPDSTAKLVGRAINVMISPLPRNKRAKNPHELEAGSEEDSEPHPAPKKNSSHQSENGSTHSVPTQPNETSGQPQPAQAGGVGNNPINRLEPQQ